MSQKVLISGTLHKKDDIWFLNTDNRLIAIGSSFIIDPALESHKVSIVGKLEGSYNTPGIDDR